MKAMQHSQKWLRQRKFLLVLPALVIPFVTMAFWALGGGNGSSMEGQATAKNEGFNLQLPGIHLKDDSDWTKMSFYEKAEKDSLIRKEQLRNDPYANQLDINDTDESISEFSSTEHLQKLAGGKYDDSEIDRSINLPVSQSKNRRYSDPNEERVMKKLADLDRVINEPSPGIKQKALSERKYPDDGDQLTEQVDRLGEMMQVMKKENNEDQEMKQLQATLDKILDIQHPERVKEKIREKSIQHKTEVLAVETEDDNQTISILQPMKSTREITDSLEASTADAERFPDTGFYGVDEDQNTDAVKTNAIEAVIDHTQELTSGSIVKMRVLQDVFIHSMLIPKDQYVFGLASIREQRINIEVTSVRHENSLFPVSLRVYDLDGLPGLFMPGISGNDAVKQSADNILQAMQLSSLNSSISAQATSAGISAAKTMISKKVHQAKITVKAGYRVLLMNTQTAE